MKVQCHAYISTRTLYVGHCRTASDNKLTSSLLLTEYLCSAHGLLQPLLKGIYYSVPHIYLQRDSPHQFLLDWVALWIDSLGAQIDWEGERMCEWMGEYVCEGGREGE